MDVKYSTGNGVAKELIGMTYGNVLREELLREWEILSGEGQKGKNWDNCNSMINKTYFKKRLPRC